jgi:hypothetical protein
MKERFTFRLIIIVMVFFSLGHSQSIQLELPELTPEQKQERAVMNSISYMMMGIAYAKQMGKTPKEYANFCAKITAPFYQRMKGQNPLPLLKQIVAVHQVDKSFTIVVLDTSTSMVKAQMPLYGLDYIKRIGDFGGVTIEDCYSFYSSFMESLCDLLGYVYQYNLQNELINFTINLKE